MPSSINEKRSINISYYYGGGPAFESLHFTTEVFCSLGILFPDPKNLASEKPNPEVYLQVGRITEQAPFH